jgi:chemotaxis protein methyltransferase CheR
MAAATIDTNQYEFIRQLVYEHSRINLGPDKTELVCARLRKRLKALSLESIGEYCELLRSPAGDDEVSDLLDAISTNVTDFFRESSHFEFLEGELLPRWTKGPRRNRAEKFKVWSAACSSGEEPYTIALVLAEYFRANGDGGWGVLGTDISTRVLKKAEQAIYRQERLKLPSPELLRRYFQKGVGTWDGHFRVKHALRERVEFRHLNLIEWPYPFRESFQAIFCRNVMIYFDRGTQEQLIPRLVEQLAPGGVLFVGHSESLIGIEHKLKCLRPSVYQKP